MATISFAHASTSRLPSLIPTISALPSLASLFSSQSANSSSAPTSIWESAPIHPLRSALASLWELLPPIVLAVPKSKVSHSRKGMRSANKGLKNKTNITSCPACGTPKMMHHICPTCYSEINRRWKSELRAGKLGSEQESVQHSSDGVAVPSA